MTELAKDAIDKLDALLRSIVPGFVLLVALIVADSQQRLGVVGLFLGNWWNGFGLGALLGIVSYAVHLSVLEDCWMRPVMRLVRWRYLNDIPPNLRTKKPSEIVPLLSRERWARTASDDKRIVALQTMLTKVYPWLIFLYCSGYLLVGGAVVLLFKGASRDGIGVWTIMVGGVLSLVAAMIADAKATRHEMWLIQKQPQF